MITLRLDWNGPHGYILYLFIALIALVIIYYFCYWTRKFKRFSFFKKTSFFAMLTDYEPDALHLYYSGQEIRDVSVTRFAIWNSGTDMIYSSEDPDDKLLSISTKDGNKISILDCSIEYVMNPGDFYKPGVPVPIRKDENSRCILIFDQIKRNDGFILQVVHTGAVKDLLLDLNIKHGRGPIEIDKKNTILRVSGMKPIARRAWEKAMKLIGWKTEFRWPTVIILEMLIISIFVWGGCLFNFPGAGFVVSTMLVFFTLSDIMGFIIYKLQLQKFPTELKKRL